MRYYHFLLLAALAGLALLVSCNQEENKEILSRLDTLENVTIVSIQGQMTAINGTLGTLQGTQAQLSGYVTSLQTAVGELQGNYAGLQSMVNSLKDRDDAFAEEIGELKDYVDQCDGDVKAWVEQAYTSLEKFNGLQSTVSGISTSITTIIGRLNALDTSTQKIANDLQTATETLTNSLSQCREEIEGIKTDLRNLQDDMDSLREQMAAIVSAVQSVVVVPDYSDGSVKMTDGESNELRFEVYPLEAASNLAALGVSALSLDCVETETKSELFTNIPLKSVTFDGEVLRVVADGSSLPAAVKVGDTAVNARLRISDGTVTRSSEYFFMTYKVADVPIAVTGESSDIGEISAKLYGWCNLESTDGTPVVFGFEYSDTDLTTSAITVFADERDEENKYCCKIPASYNYYDWQYLVPNSLYFYRAFTICNGVRIYGEGKTFKTLDIRAYVTTTDATGVYEYGATLNGSLDIDSLEDLYKEVGFIYSNSATTLEELISSGRVFSDSYISGNLSEEGKFQATISDRLFYNTKYYYVAVSYVHDRYFYGDVKSFTTLDVPEVVDLGLSVKWRSWNLGASAPYEYGDYFAWGETDSKSEYSWGTYKWYDESSWTITRYIPSDYYSVVPSDDKSKFSEYDYVDDAARTILGGTWRTPSSGEWRELYNECTMKKVMSYNGFDVAGYIFTSKKNGYGGRRIFLPAAGYYSDSSLIKDEYNRNNIAIYWSSDSGTEIASAAEFSSGGILPSRSFYRYKGLPVRPVYENEDMGTH